MKLFQRIFFAAVLSGLAAGLAMSAVQQWRVVPLILEAENYESGAADHTHEPGTPAHSHAGELPDGHVHDADAWAPQDGVERTFYTVLANTLGGIGFAFLLVAVSVLAGLPITARNGIIWGIGGFAAFQLAPAIGLPPELPGMAAAELGIRQAWWLGTALATGAGLIVLAKLRNWTGLGMAAVLVLAPHVIGAPAAPDDASVVPAHLATSFAANALATGALFWLLAGPLLGWLNERFARPVVATATEARA